MARPVGPDYRIRDINGRGTQPRPRERRRPFDPSRRTHGLRSTYVDGCRCDQCRDAQAAYGRLLYARKKAA